MNKTRRPIAVIGLVGMLALAGSTGPRAQASDAQSYGDDFAAGNFGRVTYQENGVTIRRGHDDPSYSAADQASTNAPVFPGDALITAPNQRAEVQLAGGTLIRVDRATDVTFLGLPDPYADFRDNTVLQLASGSLRVSARVPDGEEFRVDTPSASVYFVGDGDFRVQVDASGRTSVLSRRGVAEVVGNGGSQLVRGGTRTEVFPDTLPQEPRAYNTFARDDFDRWVDERNAIYQARDHYAGDPQQDAEVYESVPQEVQPYYRELESSGQWAYAPDYGYVWYPTGVSAGWRPYWDGYWNYGPSGWFWVSNEPWGWAPYHYGRWSWVDPYGWSWIPGSVFAGAWVAWSWGSLYVGWAPLDYWGAPCHYGPVYHGYYDPHAWTFVDYDHIHHHDTPRYAVPVDRTGDDLRDATVVNRPPRANPAELERSRDARAAAARSARSDRLSALRPIDEGARPGRSFRDQERALAVRGRSAADPDSSATRAGSRSSSRQLLERGVVRQQRGTERQDAGATRGQSEAVRAPRSDGPTFPGYSRRITSDRSTGTRDRTTAPGARSDERRTGAGRTGMPLVRSREGGASDTEQRVRDLYRRMATPRTPSQPQQGEPRRTQGGASQTTPPPKADDRGGTTRAPAAAPARPESRDSGARKSEPQRPSSAARDRQGARRSSPPPAKPQENPRQKDRRDDRRTRPEVGGVRSPVHSQFAAPPRATGPAAEPRAVGRAPRPTQAAPSAPAPRPPAAAQRGGSRVEQRAPARVQSGGGSRPSAPRAGPPAGSSSRSSAPRSGGGGRSGGGSRGGEKRGGRG